MPHYKDGIVAEVGDVVRGKGYNHPYEVQGVVVGVTPGASACNITLAMTRMSNHGQPPAGFGPNTPYLDTRGSNTMLARQDGKLYAIETVMEYGTCADFELISRPDAVHPPAPSNQAGC